MAPARPFLLLPALVFSLFASPRPTPPALRLGDNVRPSRYEVSLQIDPAREPFTGTIDIAIEIRQATPVIWLNAAHLSLRKATFRAGGQELAARVIPGGDEFVGLEAGQPVGPGPASLHIEYQGRISKNTSEGLFLNRFHSDNYVFSQFETSAARQAFPCFDEPGFKVPWRLTLRVPAGNRAFSNTPRIGEPVTRDGMETFRFGEMKPLPSYLVALAVGPFEVVHAGVAGRNHVPVRIITPRGTEGEATYAARISAELLTRLENYFGIPYPYAKLDNVAVPTVYGFGAMENAGLITYEQNLILSKPADESARFRHEFALVAAHEMAHQWVGDLVTLKWWNDTWLNEAFATWMDQKIVGEWRPQWGIQVQDTSSMLKAMRADRLASARAIRQPIRNAGDISDAFDTITYNKGAAVIRMFESWTGTDAFRDGVHRYLTRHAFGNADAADFLRDVSEGSGRKLTAPFSTFLDQPGVPLVSLNLHCDTNGAVLRMSQKRYFPLGSPDARPGLWQIPVCVKYGGPGGGNRACRLLTEASGELKLPSRGCPAWVIGNADETGYYHVRYDHDMLARLLENDGALLSTTERVGILGDARSLAAGGEMPEADALRAALDLRQDPDRHVVAASAGIVTGIREHLVPRGQMPRYERLVRDSFGSRARELGWNAKAGETDDTRMLRSELVPLVAGDGRDRPLIREAGLLARRWLKDRTAIAPGMVAGVLDTAARFGDRELFDEFLAAAESTQDLRERRWLIDALGRFDNPALARAALEIVLTGPFDPRSTVDLLFGPLAYPDTRDLPFEFVKTNFRALVRRLPKSTIDDARAMLPQVGGAFCSMDKYEAVRRFFEPRIAGYVGGSSMLARTLESIRICTAVRKLQQPGVAGFLASYGAEATRLSHSTDPRSSTAATSRSSR